MNSMMSRTIHHLAAATIIWMVLYLPTHHYCMRLPRAGLHVFPVDTCPRNLSEVEAASRRLKCSGIQEFSYVYHCLPRFDLSHLVEFCYDHISGWVEDGNCMVLQTQTLNNHPCKHFTKGCPNKPYLAKEMYKYPACIDIDRQKKCYLMDPNCTSITSSRVEESGGPGWIAVVVTPIVVLIVVVLVIIIIIKVQRRRASRSHRNTAQDQTNSTMEMDPLLSEINGPPNEREEQKGNGESRDNHHSLKNSIFVDWDEEDSLFVPTKASKTVKNEIKYKNFLTVVGNSGSGKSAILQHIALKYKEEGWDVIPIDDVSEIKEACSTGLSKKMFVFDDPVGKESLCDIKYEYWKSYESTLKSCLKEVKILLSCRLCVFNDKRLKGIMKEINNSVRIDDDALKLSREEKLEILDQHTKSIKFTEEQTEEIIKTDAYFPLLCKLFSSESKYKEKGISFFKKPFEIVREEIEMFKNSKRPSDKSKYSALILLVFLNNNVSLHDLEKCRASGFLSAKYKAILSMSGLSDNTPIESVTKGFELLRGSFVKYVGGSYQFIHDFVLEITTFFVGTISPKQTIKYADSGFLRRRVAIEDDKQERDPFTVYLPDRYIDDLVQRFLLDIQTERLLDVVLHPCLRNKKVVDSFVKRLEKQTIALECLQKLAKVDEYELGSVKENMVSRLGFFLTQGEVTPLSALIIFCHDEIALSCLENVALSDISTTLASIYANGNTVLYDIFPNKQTVEFSNVKWGGFYALHIASLFHNVEMLQKSICHSESIGMSDDHGLTPLMCAVLNDEEADSLKITDSRGTLQYLLSNDADTNLCHKTGISPLYIACQNGNASIVQLLLNHNADVKLYTKNGTSPLYIASQNGHSNTVKVLLNNGADINLCLNDGTTPLYAASFHGHDNTVQLLLNNGADVNSFEKNGMSPLYIASQNGHDSTVQLLLNYGADINVRKSNGSSPLYTASGNGHYKTVQVLLKKGADINSCTGNGSSPLLFASANGHDNTVQLLLNNDADVNLCRDDGASPLYAASQIGHAITVQLLLNSDANVNLCKKDGASPLFVASQNGHASIIQLLLINDADVNLCRNEISPLFMASQNGHDRVVQLLLINGADVNLCKSGRSSPLVIACAAGHDSIVKLLLNNGADIRLCSKSGIGPLTAACCTGHDNMVQLLLNKGSDVNSCEEDGTSPLVRACQCGHDSTIQLLLNNGADINLCERKGASPLYKASVNGYDSTVKLLLNNGADINLSMNDGASPLHAACFEGHDSTVQLLLKNGTDVNLRMNDGTSPLFLACRNGHDSTVQLLLNKRADINSCKSNGMSPIYIACYNEHESTVQLLLKNEANIHLCTNDGTSPLFIASQNGQDSMVKLLVNNGADINVCEKNGCSPLYIASQNGHKSTVQLLLNNGADINLCNTDGASPLCIASQNGHESTVKLLLKYGANVNLCKENGASPLYVASQNGHDSTIQRLLNNGADVNLCNKNESSPLCVASRNGHDSTVRLLRNNGANTSLCRNDGIGTLNIASQNGHDGTVELSLNNGADTNSSINDEGQSSKCSLS